MDPFRMLAPIVPAPVRVEGTVLAFERDEKLPRVCLKCGARSQLTRTQTLQEASGAGTGMGAMGGVIGSVVAQQAHGDILLAALIGGGVAAVVVAVVWLSTSKGKASQSAVVDLPLCEQCDKRWSDGLAIRSYVLAGLALSAVVGLFGALSTITACYWIAALIFVGVLIYAFSQRLRDRFIGGAHIDPTTVRLTALSPTVLSAITAELSAPRKKKKKKRAEPELQMETAT